jgi:thymidylate synthase
MLLQLFGKMVNMVPDKLIGNLGDVHLYSNHLDGAREQIAITSEAFELPTLTISNREVADISDYVFEDLILNNYKSHGKINFPLSN